MSEKIQVLDHGYLSVVQFWGSDEQIVEAARMSTGRGFLGWGPVHEDGCAWKEALFAHMETAFDPGAMDLSVDPSTVKCTCTPKAGDEKLLRFLAENHHDTPFEMAGAIVEVQAPIFVFREWHRHRTQSYNEMSARYAPLPDVNYIPSVERLMLNSKTNKQAGVVAGAAELTEAGAEQFRYALEAIYGEAEQMYQNALSNGVPKELARVHLPVGRYSRMRASANLRNWLAFLTLRMAQNAQYEIRQYANAMHDVLAARFPRTLGLFQERISR